MSYLIYFQEENNMKHLYEKKNSLYGCDPYININNFTSQKSFALWLCNLYYIGRRRMNNVCYEYVAMWKNWLPKSGLRYVGQGWALQTPHMITRVGLDQESPHLFVNGKVHEMSSQVLESKLRWKSLRRSKQGLFQLTKSNRSQLC